MRPDQMATNSVGSPLDAPASHPTVARPGRRRRRLSMSVALLAVVALLASSCITKEQGISLNLLNGDRVRYGLPTVPIHGDAQTKAQAWAEKMAREGRLSHSVLSDGFRPGSWCLIGENVGYHSHRDHVAALFMIQSEFMKSPGHRTHIVNRRYTHVGIGIARDSSGATYVAQVFFRPRVNGRC